MKRSLLPMFAMLILSSSTLQANMSPGSYPADRKTIHAPFAGLDTTSPGRTDSTIQADIASQPTVPKATSPVPMVVAGLAATAGVALLGLWIAKKGRSGNSQDQ